MKLRFFSIPAWGDAAAEQELNAYLAKARVREIDRRFVDRDDGAFWALCIVETEGDAPLSKPRGKRVDYRAELSPEDFVVFGKLREVRKKLAEEAGVPIYAVAENAQLAEFVKRKITTEDALREVAGIGPHRAQTFGPPLLEVLCQAFGESKATDK